MRSFCQENLPPICILQFVFFTLHMYAIFLSRIPAANMYTSIRLYSYTAYVCDYNFGRCRSANTVQSVSLSICCVIIEYNFVSTPIILYCYTVTLVLYCYTVTLVCIPQSGCIFPAYVCEQYGHCILFAYICSVRIQTVSTVFYASITSILSLEIVVRVSKV